MISTRALSIALFAVAALVPLAALAEPTEAQKREAKDLNEKATRLYEVGKYGEAIEEYQKVYLLVEDPVLLYNIAQSYRLWGKPEDSVRFYRNYLRRSPGAPNRADVERKIADQEKIIEERKRSPVTAPPPVTNPPAEVTAPPPPPPPVQNLPGTTPPPMVEQPPLVTQPMTPPPTDYSGRRKWGVGLLIGGGVALVISVATGAYANSQAKKLERMSNDGSHPAFDPDIQQKGKNFNSAAIVTGVLGAAAGITGAVLLLSIPSAEKPVALFPMVGPQVAGGGARVAF